MLRDKLVKTATGFFVLLLIILIARGLDQLLPIEALQITRPATVVALSIVIVFIVRPWIPRGRRR